MCHLWSLKHLTFHLKMLHGFLKALRDKRAKLLVIFILIYQQKNVRNFYANTQYIQRWRKSRYINFSFKRNIVLSKVQKEKDASPLTRRNAILIARMEFRNNVYYCMHGRTTNLDATLLFSTCTSYHGLHIIS